MTEPRPNQSPPGRHRPWSRWRLVGALLILAAVAASWAHHAGGRLPSLSWIYRVGEIFANDGPDSADQARTWFGTIVCTIAAIIGLRLVIRGGSPQWNPQTIDRWRRFRSLRRGWWSLLILLFLILLAMLDFTLVGKRALAVRHDGQWYFPAFREAIHPGTTFGQAAESEADYRRLQQDARRAGNGDLVIMPLVPWDPVLDTDSSQTAPLEQRDDGLWYREGRARAHSGLAQGFYDEEQTERRVEYRFRRGLPDGFATGYNEDGEPIFEATFRRGEMVGMQWSGDIEPDPERAAEILAGPLAVTLYAPLPPLLEARHFLGTDSRGWDLLAQIYGGWQVNLQAAVLFLIVTYGIGVMVGCVMGYFGGLFDLTVQRVIEVLGNIPFLYVVIIITAVIGRENMNLMLMVGVICIFSWLGLTYYMRTATYREKARLYIDSARIAGASTPRVIVRHVLPNVPAIIVTFVPFSVASIINSLTALSFIGFGLPDRYPAWGTVISDGIDHLSSPWIVSSVFVCMVVILLLITFVGEAVREAFDPKRFSTYR